MRKYCERLYQFSEKKYQLERCLTEKNENGNKVPSFYDDLLDYYDFRKPIYLGEADKLILQHNEKNKFKPFEGKYMARKESPSMCMHNLT